MHEQRQDAEASGDEPLRPIEIDEREPIAVREGDVLVVSYPEVKIPLAKFTFATVGGLIYTRRLVPGDDIQNEYDQIYAFLERNAERSAREKVRKWAAELSAPPPAKAVAPKPPERAASGSVPAMHISPETAARAKAALKSDRGSVEMRARIATSPLTTSLATNGKPIPPKPTLAKRPSK